ncbi:MAG: DEAD/DEAH box helicase [Anaerolineae bacterium]
MGARVSREQPISLQEVHPAVAAWFCGRFEEATAAQRLGWPTIQRGEHVLILVPTGSGKTLAAFLWGYQRAGRAPATRAGTAGRSDCANFPVVWLG